MKISVIIPYYNTEKYISECLDSVLGQTYKDFEIICVDNNSTDKTSVIVESYIEKYPNKIINIKEEKKGASFARNTGFAESKGEYIQFLDADDIIVETKFDKQLEMFQKTNADIIVSDRIVKNEAFDKILAKLTYSKIEANPLEIATTEIITTGNPLYRRTIVEKVNCYDSSLKSAQDWDFHLRLVLENAIIKYLPGYFFISRQVEYSLSSNWKDVSIQAVIVIKKIKKQLIKTDNITDKVLLKFQNILYLSAVYTKDKQKRKEYIAEIKYWIKYRNISNLHFSKQIIANVFGYNALIFLEKLRKK